MTRTHRRTTLLAAAALTISMAAVPAAAAPTWLPQGPVGPAFVQAFSGSIAVDSAGNAVAVWPASDSDENQVRASSRPAGGRGAHPSRCRRPVQLPCSRRWCWQTTAARPRSGSDRPGCSPSACRVRPGAPTASGARPWTSRAAAPSATGPPWGCFRTEERSSCGRASCPGRGTKPRPCAHRAGPGATPSTSRPRPRPTRDSPRSAWTPPATPPWCGRATTARTTSSRRRPGTPPASGARSSRCRRWARTPSTPASPSTRRARPRPCGPASTAPATSRSRAPAPRPADSGQRR